MKTEFKSTRDFCTVLAYFLSPVIECPELYNYNKKNILIWAFSVLFLMTTPIQAELYNMGEEGFYESVDIKSIESFNSRLQCQIGNIRIEPREIVFTEETLVLTPVILEKAQKYNVRTVKLNKPISLKEGMTILIFNPKDISCVDKLKGLTIDAAYCVNTADPKDVQSFWQQAGQYPPTQMVNRELLGYMSVLYYPSLVKIKGDHIEIIEGF